MSSVSVEASLKSSNRPSAAKTGLGTSTERRNGFSTLVDSNLSAAHTDDRSERPAQPASNDRTSARPAGTDRKDAPRTEARNGSTPATETGTRVERKADAAQTDAAAPASKEETDGKATETEATTSDADATAQAADAETQAVVSMIDSNDAIPVANPPATAVPAPAETAAAALNRVAADTALDPVAVTAAAAAGAEAAAKTDPVPLPTEIKAEGEIKGEKVSAQVDAKAQNDLATPGKPADVTSDDAQQHGKLTARADISPVAQDDTQKPADAAAEPHKTGAAETRGAAQPHANTERTDTEAAKPAARPAHEQVATPSATATTHAPSTTDLLQSNGFGLAQVSPTHTTAAVQTPQLTAVAATNIPVPMNGLAVEIVANTQIGRSRFEIRLDPPELGRIDVRLDVDKQGQVTSHLIVEKSSTLDMLRRDAPQLERALQDAGLKTSDSGLQFSLRDQSQSQRNNDNDSGRNGHRLHIVEDEPVAVEPAARGYGRMIGQRGGIDIRV